MLYIKAKQLHYTSSIKSVEINMKLKEVKKRLDLRDKREKKAVYTSADLRAMFEDATEARFNSRTC